MRMGIKKIWTVCLLIGLTAVMFSGCKNSKDSESSVGDKETISIKEAHEQKDTANTDSSLQQSTNALTAGNEEATTENITEENESESVSEDALDKAVKQLEELNDLLEGED